MPRQPHEELRAAVPLLNLCDKRRELGGRDGVIRYDVKYTWLVDLQVVLPENRGSSVV